jgi:DNA repair protein RadA/Sms
VARAKSHFACQSCGASYSRWQGRCDACGGWNSIVEEAIVGPVAHRTRRTSMALQSLAGSLPLPQRLVSGVSEFDRVLGGGLVPGAAVLIGGDPGIGKSTLLLQVAAALAARGLACAYISAEEAIGQIALRANRLGLADSAVRLSQAGNVAEILAGLDGAQMRGGVVVIDSIQTVFLETLDSAPGTVAQVRAAVQELIRYAKTADAAMLLIGHVTKEGQIAGPRLVEHMVDSVLYLEGERGHRFRILRAVKNRYGATDEIGVFDMTDRGLMEVTNPSLLFLGERREPTSGTAVFAGIEGTRPLLVEIQALVAASGLATPRRAVVGWDGARLAMLLAVLDARCGLGFAGQEVYLNVAGGLKIQEPAADLAVAAALVSALSDRALEADTLVFGEVGLTGEIRPVGHVEARLKEGAKLGFRKALMPAGQKAAIGGIDTIELAHLHDLLAHFPLPRLRQAGRVGG